jgi:hypothetical protein
MGAISNGCEKMKKKVKTESVPFLQVWHLTLLEGLNNYG